MLKRDCFKLECIIQKSTFDSIINYFLEPLVINSEVSLKKAMAFVKRKTRQLFKIAKTVPDSLMDEVIFHTDFTTRWMKKR
jgi:hypothetical protein